MGTLTDLIPNVIQFADQFPQAIVDTLIMLVLAGSISFVFGLIFAVLVIVTKPGGILENKVVWWILDKVINLFRAIPFIILIPMLLVVTRAVFHTTIGIKGALILWWWAPFHSWPVRWKPPWKRFRRVL